MEDCAVEVYKDLRFYFNKKVPFSLLSGTTDITQARRVKQSLIFTQFCAFRNVCRLFPNYHYVWKKVYKQLARTARFNIDAVWLTDPRL